MNLFHHLKEQPFLAAVSAAAVVHSSWSLSTYFTGPEPRFTGDIPGWIIWVLPGFLLAFSVDVGLLSLAHQIRQGEGNRAKLLAFFVLSLAMAYSQFLYIVAHLPAVAVADGVRLSWRETLMTVRDAAVIVLPMLLPTALILYAFSDRKRQQAPTPPTDNAAVTETALVTVEPVNDLVARCPQCGWVKGYETPDKARSGLAAHSRHCKAHMLEILTPEEVDR